MGSLILIISAKTAISFAMRYSETTDADRIGVIWSNYVSGTLLAVVLSDGLSMGDFGEEAIAPVLGLAAMNSVLMVCGMFFLQISIKRNGTGLSTTYNKLGILIPTILSIFLFNEIPTMLKMLGIALSTFAVIYSYSRSKEESHKNYTLLFLLLVFGGIIDLNSKLTTILSGNDLKPVYVIGTFLFCALIMTIMVIIKKTKIRSKELFLGTLIGIPNSLVTFGMVSAAASLPAYIVYPVYSGAVIILVNCISAGILKEKLTKREVISTCMIVIALILLNI